MESRIVEYMLHDPIGNVEGTLTDFSEEFLAKVADSPSSSSPWTRTGAGLS